MKASSSSVDDNHNKSETSMQYYSFSIMTPIRKGGEGTTEEFSLGFCGCKCNVTQRVVGGLMQVQNANFGYQSFYAKITIFSIIVSPQHVHYMHFKQIVIKTKGSDDLHHCQLCHC